MVETCTADFRALQEELEKLTTEVKDLKSELKFERQQTLKLQNVTSQLWNIILQLQNEVNTSAVQNEIVLAALYERLVTTETVISSLTPGRSPAFPAASCQEIKQLRHDQGNQVYYVSPTGQEVLPVYCDMTTLGGGWTLIVNQISSTYYRMNDVQCLPLSGLNVPGVQCGLDSIMSLVDEIRYTDENQVTFLHAELNGTEYWSVVGLPISGSTLTGVPVAVRYVKGPLANTTRYIEASGRFHWGHRNTIIVGNMTGIEGFPTCKHFCWEDVAAPFLDRPFVGDLCPLSSSISFCPGYDPVFTFPSTATRGGSFNFRKWVR